MTAGTVAGRAPRATARTLPSPWGVAHPLFAGFPFGRGRSAGRYDERVRTLTEEDLARELGTTRERIRDIVSIRG